MELKSIEAFVPGFQSLLQVGERRRQLSDLQKRLAGESSKGEIAGAIKKLDDRVSALAGSNQFQYPPPTEPTLSALNGALASLLVSLDGADAAPTAQALAAYDSYRDLLNKTVAGWTALREKELAALNAMLRQYRLSPLTVQ